ncbi:MAG: hypothetical protein R3C46_08365 [Hyphomonadaceae bacterium]
MENETPDDDTGPQSKTLISLKKKKEALARLRADYYAKIKGLERDMAALDAAMRVFDPKAWANRQAEAKKAQRRRHIAARFIMDFLREAGGQTLARAITEAWIAEQGIENDAHARQVYGQRISNALANLRRKGITESEVIPGAGILWKLTDQA